jgi:hypothetical protein
MHVPDCDVLACPQRLDAPQRASDAAPCSARALRFRAEGRLERDTRYGFMPEAVAGSRPAARRPGDAVV